jgi:hypothetical protein
MKLSTLLLQGRVFWILVWALSDFGVGVAATLRLGSWLSLQRLGQTR